MSRFDLLRRARAAAIHLLISGVVAAVAGALVFGLWYPGPYRLLSGGRDLFFLIVSVDVVMGPLLTFTVFNVTKGWPHLSRDLAVIAAMQLGALGYGLHTVYEVRPVAMVFEVDRFRVIAAVDVYLPELDLARPEYRRLPVAGPWLLGTRATRAGAERNQAIMLGLKGYDVSQRPIFWQPYDESKGVAIAHAKPVTKLLEQYPQRHAELDSVLKDLNLKPDDLWFLPLMARVDWVVLLKKTGEIAGFAPFDGFF